VSVPTLAEDHALLCAATRAGGAIAKDFFGGPLEVRDKTPGDPVSEADLAVDAEIKRQLTAARPDYGWLSEETADTPARLEARRVWVVDPIDGTKAFVAARPDFAVSVALRMMENRLYSACLHRPRPWKTRRRGFRALSGQMVPFGRIVP